ncbi:WD40-repeat-containing domain protein [Pelagophyceae sp. CCMP2097]|nr:WD40-repeat-containing domain protein [Pelagophyceae sp. CCMP2097]
MASCREKIETAKAVVTALKAKIESEKMRIDDVRGFKCDAILQTLADAPRARKTLKGHFGKVYALHWAGSSRDVVSASQDGKLIVWNALTATMTHAIKLRKSWVMTCAFEQSRNELVACGGLDNLCSVYKLNAPQAARAAGELAGHDGYLSMCRFVDESTILTTSGDSTCIRWDVERAKAAPESAVATGTFADHTGDVMCLSVDPHNPQRFVTGSCDAHAKVWDARAGHHAVMTFAGHDSDINSVAFFPDGQSFGSGSDDSTCRCFDLRSLMALNTFKADRVLCGVTSVDFSISGRLLFAGYDDAAALAWDVSRDGRVHAPVYALGGHDHRVSCLGVAPSGVALCTGSWDTRLVIWS